ncbi:tyrosinase protein tyr-3 [Biomphalaria glabrata]|nr:tyrosinase protein tyr-3 [Biomphalaria glabrata]
MKTNLIYLVLVTLSITEVTKAKLCDIPVPKPLQECYERVKSFSVDRYVGSLYSWLCEHTLINSTRTEEPIDPETASYIQGLLESALPSSSRNQGKRYRVERQATQPPCTRKEYRMLTLAERNRFHNAINTLKRDTSVRPNAYDAIANIHTGTTNLIAHNGPGFLGWHRVYLLMYENALRRVDPTVCIPYWDSTLDNQLTNPLASSIWSPEFLGTSNGAVTTGPFANWRRPNGAQLIRNVGADGDLLSTTVVNDVLSRPRYEDIVVSNAPFDPQFNLEVQHGSVHIYVGGTMSLLNTAAFDPTFFLHHAYIDFWFERMRNNLRARGINPAIYPNVPTNARHVANATTGFTGYRQVDGYSETLARRAVYEPVPTCSVTSPACGNRFLVCQLSSGRCVPPVRTTIGKRSADIESSEDTCDKPRNFDLPYQNDFCVGEWCDFDEWAIIPVKIVHVRPPKFKTYNSYPVISNTVDQRLDIYSPKAYNETRRFISNRQGNPLTYSRCNRDMSVGQIYLYSHGLNYPGFYKESTIIDQKLPVSVTIGYVGVKRPAPGEELSKALLRAHDSCGRVCHAACRDPDTNEFKACSGAVAVSEEHPLLFGNDFDEAVLSVFDYDFNKDCPKVQTDNFYITFYCDYPNKFPFAHPDPQEM